MASRRKSADTSYETVKVVMKTLDQWTAENGIDSCDYMKIDIEGAEFFVFLGGKRFIERTRPVIQCEYNKYWLDNAGVSFKDFSEFFLDLNYAIGIERSSYYEIIDRPRDFAIHENLEELLFMPREKLALLSPLASRQRTRT